MQSFYGSKEKQGRSSGRKDRVRGSLSPCGPTYYSPGVGLYDHFGDPRDYADETLDDQETHAETFQSPSGASSDRTRTPIATGQSSCYQLLDARRTQETRLPLVHSRVTNDPQSNSQHHQIIQQENQIPSSSDGSTPTGTGSRYQILNHPERRIPFRCQTNDSTSLHSLIQQQQATLQTLLEGQQAIQEKQLALERKVCDLEKTQDSAASKSTTTTHKRKKLVSSHLSVS